MKKAMIWVLAVVLAGACDDTVTDLGRPILVTGNSGSTASAVAGVFVDPANPAISVGTTAQLSARAVDSNGAAITGTVAWTSSSAAVASVDGSGVVTGRGPGTAVISATVNGRTGSAIVSVT